MKNELGIEVCCENCICNDPTNYIHCDDCIDKACFHPSYLILQSHIKELQEQQFTEKELNSLQVALILAKDEFNFTPADNLLKKIEQTLKNLEKD